MARISVVIPARNAAATLSATLDSLVAQTFTDFDVVLVNDASDDDTPHIAESYAVRLSIQVLGSKQNQGVANSINRGVAHSDSEFIARLDSDDLARPDRLERQVGFMLAQPSLDVCGSHMEIFVDGQEGAGRSLLAHPTGNSQIKTALVQRCAIAHPSVMVRRRFFDSVGGYDARYDFAEDYELWTRAALLGSQFANIAEPLTHYRRHAGQVSQQKAQLQFYRDIQIKNKYLAGWLDGQPSGHLAEFLSLQTQFSSRDVALLVLADAAPALLHLGRRLPHPTEFADIVSGSLRRHLA